MTIPQYISPAERTNPTDYAAAVRQYNHSLQLHLVDQLQQQIPWVYEGCAVFTTGSDGRLEKGPVSGMEFIVLVKEVQANRELGRLLARLHSFKPIYPVESGLDIRVLERDAMSIVFGDKNRVYPMRINDLAYLDGTEGLDHEAKIKLFREFVGEDGRSILDKVRSKKREYKEVTKTGKQQFNKDVTLQHFDMDAGVAFYDPEQKKLSFKLGPLRYVQTAVMQDMIAFARKYWREEVPESHPLLRAPANTADKLLFLEAEGQSALSPAQISELIEHYNYFLWLYHLSQENFKQTKGTTLNFDTAEVQKRASSLDGLLTDRVIQV